WAGTDGGLVELAFKNSQKKIKAYTTKNGLPDNIVTHIQSYKNQLILGFHAAGIGSFTDNTFISWCDSPNKGALAMLLAQDELYWVADDQSVYVYDFLHQRSRVV